MPVPNTAAFAIVGLIIFFHKDKIGVEGSIMVQIDLQLQQGNLVKK